jgi:hypothetical protein
MPFGKRRRGEDNIKIDVKGTGYEGVNCIHLAQDRVQWRALLNPSMSLRVPKYAGNFLTIYTTVSFSRLILLLAVVG